MELTDQLYNRISRYADGGMDASEIESFEADMKQDKELAAEVKLYTDIQAVCRSIQEKMEKNIMVQMEDKKTKEAEAWAMITQARKEWETENGKKVEGGRIFIEQHQVKKPLTGKIVNMPGWSMLAAASVLGIIIFAGLWWYMQKKQPSSTIAANKADTGSQTITAKKENNKSNETVLSKSDTSSIKNSLPPANETALKNINTKELFAANFRPDVAPADKETLLEEPFSFYNAKNYTDAIETFEMARATLETRGEKQGGLTTSFYIHYYLGLSYLAAGSHTNNAIEELKEAIKTSANDDLKSKARWYLALAYLKTGKEKEAASLFEQISKNNEAGKYKQKAVNLLKEVNRN